MTTFEENVIIALCESENDELLSDKLDGVVYSLFAKLTDFTTHANYIEVLVLLRKVAILVHVYKLAKYLSPINVKKLSILYNGNDLITMRNTYD